MYCLLLTSRPRKMMGYESNGMILSAERADGKLVVASTLDDMKMV